MKISPAIQRPAAWLVILLGMLLCRLSFVDETIYNIDEAEYAVAADALSRGWLPGVDLLGSTKPPGVALLYFLLFEIFGRSLTVIHAAHLVIMIAAGILLVELAVAMWGIPAALPAAGLFWMVSNSFNLPYEIMALNVESPAIVGAVAALLVAWKARGNAWAWLLSGTLMGIAMLFRQTLGAFLLPLFYLALSESERRLRGVVFALIGVFLPWLPVLMVYAGRGAFGWAWDSWLRYPFAYSSDTGFLGFLLALYYNGNDFLIQAAIPVAAAVWGGIILWRGPRERVRSFLLWMTLASVLALCSGSRFFGHYWIQVFPIVALLGVPAWFALHRVKRSHRLLLVGGVMVGVAVAALHFPAWRAWDRGAMPRGVSIYRLGGESLEFKVAQFARENTTPDQTIVVWGYCPQIYYHANRLPGVRDYLCHYITGYSPGSFDPMSERAVRPYGHPQAEAMFVEDLERRQPKYIFDLVKVYDYAFPFVKYSLRTYPMLADYLRQNYLPEGQIGDVFVYRRRTPEDTWWPSPEDIE
ncbi:MAG: glycosyltransferase family 39 protein [bacterium]|nr:glycosyltransferase family 39 protein [bacterium]